MNAAAATYLIRPIQPDDKPQWLPLWDAYLDFYETRLSAAVTDTTFARFCDPACTDMQALVADGPAGVVGFAHLVFHRHGWRTEDVCYLEDLFVAPGLRGTGLGRSLIEAVYQVADLRGVDRVYWMTQTFNTVARQLYDRIGEATPFMKYQRKPA